MGKYEIERKWLFDLSKIPEDKLECLGEYRIHQGYMSIRPEVRIRTKERLDSKKETTYKICFKSKGDLKRIETQFDLTAEQFNSLKEIAQLKDNDFIEKIFKKYIIDGYELAVGVTDVGRDTVFSYGEIEFESEEEAVAFIAPEWFGQEVTEDSSYKMVNYWARTRLNK